MALYFLTGLLYPHTEIYDRYRAALLVFGALCIPSCYVGIRLARGNYNKQMLNLLPLFVILISLAVGTAIVFKSATGSLLNKEDDALNYQTSSYYMAGCFSYCMFFLFFNNQIKKSFSNKIIRIILFALLFLCAIGTILGGGRGAFVYLVLIALYMIYRITKEKGGGAKFKNVLLLLVAAGVLVYLASRFNIIKSAGASRLIERLGTIDEGEARFDSWNDAIRAFYDSPILGHGIGSVWWTVGFYSHNMLADLLAETGLLGTTIVVSVLGNIFIRQSRNSYSGGLDMFLFLVFLGALVHDAFSGYWISSPKLFLLYGYVYGQVQPHTKKTV